jgi:hypothetical protein
MRRLTRQPYRFPESTEVTTARPGPFVVSHEIWEQAAGVSSFLGRVAPADRVGGEIDPSRFFFDNPVDRLRTRKRN